SILPEIALEVEDESRYTSARVAPVSAKTFGRGPNRAASRTPRGGRSANGIAAGTPNRPCVLSFHDRSVPLQGCRVMHDASPHFPADVLAPVAPAGENGGAA